MNKLRKLIEQSGKSQTQVAKELGISPPRLMADYFGVSVDCLLDREQKKTVLQEVRGSIPLISTKKNHQLSCLSMGLAGVFCYLVSFSLFALNCI